MKFEIRYCGIAEDRPQTRIAGQIWTMPRQSAEAQISQAGTISEKKRQLLPDHRAKQIGVEPGHARKAAIGVPSAP